MKIINSKAHRQQGTVLAVSLILLLLMTIIGVTAIQTTTLDERMAANARSKNLAFQAAESALREGEKVVREKSWDLLKEKVSDQKPDSEDDEAWQNKSWNKQTDYSGTIGNVVAQPSYVIEKLTGTGSSLNPRDMTGLYRVTAYGQGNTETAVAVLERIVRRTNTQ